MLGKVILLFLFCLCIQTWGLVGMPMDDFGAMLNQRNPHTKMTDEESVEAIEAYILKEMFFDPIFNDTDALSEILSSDEDEEDDDMGLNSGMDMHKGILSDQLSKRFSKRDILGLKRKFLKRGDAFSL